MVYCADYAAFPYGEWAQDDLQSHLMDQISVWIADSRPDAVVIACNTASTLILPGLRARFDMPVVGTVPAIKPAAAITRTNMVSVLATPGTVTRDYTHSLLRQFASTVEVALIGSPSLASLVEQWFLDGSSPQLEAAIEEQLAPCFKHNPQGMKTDSVVLACTHFPLLKPLFRRLAPWPVHWLDPSPAIARQAAKVLGGHHGATGTGTFEIISSQPGLEGRVKTVWQMLSTQLASGLTEQI
jgi:glutamate racemase